MYLLSLGSIMSDNVNCSSLLQGWIFFTCDQEFLPFLCWGHFAGASDCPMGVSPLTKSPIELICFNSKKLSTEQFLRICRNCPIGIPLINGLERWLEANRRVLAAVSFLKVLAPQWKWKGQGRKFYCDQKYMRVWCFYYYLYSTPPGNPAVLQIDPFHITRIIDVPQKFTPENLK